MSGDSARGGQTLVFLVLSVLLGVGWANYDQATCEPKLSAPVGSAPPVPAFQDNFKVHLEKKNVAAKLVSNLDLYFSKSGGRAFLQDKNAYNTSDHWVLTDSNEILNANINNIGSYDCQAQVLTGSNYGIFLGATNNNNQVTLGFPSEAMQFSRGSEKRVYLGKDFLGDRGIAVQKYQSCTYMVESDTTSLITWMFSDPTSMVMPADTTNPLLIMSDVTSLSPANKFHYRYDYTHNYFNLDSTDERFEVPSELFCIKAKSASSLPATPDNFQYKGEQIIQDKDSLSPPTIEYFKETFLKHFNLFIVENEASGSSYIRTVSDFNRGVMYSLDLKSGICQSTAISASNVGAYSIGGGMVQMRTSKQFFDLDSDSYQYVGKHQHRSRGIVSDVYATVDQAKKSIRSWYFADKGWQSTLGYQNPYTMPVTMVIDSAERKVVFNFFEYSSHFDISIPEITLCFNQTNSINVEVYFTGRFDKVVTPDPKGFEAAFYSKITKVTQIVSPIRVGKLDVQPASANEIVVRFRLLDKAKTKGDVSQPVAESSAQEALQKLYTSVNAGQFVLDIERRMGGHVSLKAKPNGAGTYVAGKFRSSNSASSFSAGAMAGIGVGMLVLGLVLGVAALFIFKRVRGGSQDNIGMSKFSSETS